VGDDLQFYVNGYRPGDPLLDEPHPSVATRPVDLPDQVDVLIVGCGPAGLVLAAQLANFPEINTAVIDRRDGPLAVGQADGVACRTVEMFETFGLARQLVEEAYWVNEVCFWQPDPDDRALIRRAGRVADTETGVSEFPHVIVNQARMLAYLLDHMWRSSSRLSPYYGVEATDLAIDPADETPYPVAVTVEHVRDGNETGETSRIRAKYVVGCDGARSAIRRGIDRELVGDAMNVSWGVMDVLSVTDFPDIRFKCTIQSAEHGSVLLIPREGGYLARFYVELDENRAGALPGNADITPETLTAVANRVMHPYKLEVREVGWWSVYEIGQRLCDKFDDAGPEDFETRLPRVFIAGDACHTHSAKAGQGMNVSMADTFNLGWKLAAVLGEVARPELLHTYSKERQAVAQELISFDHEFSQMMSSRPRRPGEADSDGVDPEEFQRSFVKSCRYTAGVATHYAPSLITGSGASQRLAIGFPVGMRFQSAPVIRLADAKPLQLGHVARADGAWRLYVFADHRSPVSPDSEARALCEFLASSDSPLRRFTPRDADPDSVIDVRAVFQQSHHELDLASLPSVLLPRKGRYGLVDSEKAFCAAPDDDIFELRGVDREVGCMVLVRPDQYVADVFGLDAQTGLVEFLEQILVGSGDAELTVKGGRR
jgi:phenol 2-monooxygenase (NADPH)